MTPGTVTERILGRPHGHPDLSLVCVARRGGMAFALEVFRRGDWRRLHSYTLGEAQALAELIAVYHGLSDAAEPVGGLYHDDDAFADAELTDAPF